MPDFSRLARKPSERLALVEHVLTTTGLEETDYLEWKSAYNLERKPGTASVAKQLIGMANRDFAHSGRHAEGHAYVLLGVEPGKLTGVPHWDSADIENWLSRFVPAELRYVFHYVSIEDKEVLLLVVDPPRQGDPIFCLENASEEVCLADSESQRDKNLPKGAIYVRHGGVTGHHTPEDLRRLSARCITTGQPTLDLNLELDTTCLRVIDSALLDERYMSERLENWRAQMIRPTRRDSSFGVFEQRRLPEYQDEVDMYERLVRDAWSKLIAYEMIVADQSKLGLTVQNNSDENFENVVIEVCFALDRTGVHLSASEAHATLQIPEEPTKWGERLIASIKTGALANSSVKITSKPSPEVERVNDGTTMVRFPEFRLRPTVTFACEMCTFACRPRWRGKTLRCVGGRRRATPKVTGGGSWSC